MRKFWDEGIRGVISNGRENINDDEDWRMSRHLLHIHHEYVVREMVWK